MADTVMSLRHVVKELARQSGVAASFMPKPLVGVQGSGMHTHLSLWRDEKNAFIGEHTYGLSDLAAKFIAGLVATRPRSRRSPTSGSTPTSASCPGSKAPVGAEWARYDAAALVRVPSVKPGRIDSTRIEYRSPDAGRQPLPRLRGHPGGRSSRCDRQLRTPQRG
jgi:glutamine synthetase